MKNIKCLFLSSFSESSLKLKDNLKKVFSHKGIELIHPADLDFSKSLLEGTSELFGKADFVIADISELNPNVLFEIGYAKALGLPTVIIADNKTEIPMSIGSESMNYIQYEKKKGLNRKKIMDILSIIERSGKVSHEFDILEKPLSYETHPLISNPFEFLSAEIMPSDIIQKLFVTPPYFELVNNPETTVLFGPRGCGKTSLLYMLRFKYRFPKTGIAGFYFNFNNELRGALEVSKVISDKNKMIKYFNLGFFKAFTNEIDLVRKMNKISDNEEREVLTIIEQETGFSADSFSRLSTRISNFQQQELNKDVYGFKSNEKTESPILFVDDKLSNPIFLKCLTESLCKNTLLFSKMSIAFLLDDYSSDWIPESTSHALHQIIFKRSPWYSFKIAIILGRQKVWPIGKSSYAEAYRDYIPINMADILLRKPYTYRKYLRKILDRRLKFAGSCFSSKLLFGLGYGKNQWELDYSGIQGFSRLFSGDFATLIGACNKMTQTKSVDVPIPPEIQNRVLLSISTELLESLRLGYRWGNYVYNFVYHMMKFIKTRQLILKKSEESKMVKREIISGITLRKFKNLSEESQEKISWLVRSGIFLPIDPTIENRKYRLRKTLFPAFHLPIVGRSLFLKGSEELLNDPEGYWHMKIEEIKRKWKA